MENYKSLRDKLFELRISLEKVRDNPLYAEEIEKLEAEIKETKRNMAKKKYEELRKENGNGKKH